jgi:hypothetical protein
MRKLILCLLLFVVSPVYVKADQIDFSCNLGSVQPCTGKIAVSSGDYFSKGIDIEEDHGPFSTTVPFELVFDTAMKTISIDGTGVDKGLNLIGTLDSFNVLNHGGTSDISFAVDWTKLAPAVQSFLGSKTGSGTGSTLTISLVEPGHPGKVGSADFVISPTVIPEPGTISLFAIGLLAVGLWPRIKIRC